MSSALRLVTAQVGGHSYASDAPGGTAAPSTLEGDPGDLAAEVCSNSRALQRVEFSSAAICGNVTFCWADGKRCGSIVGGQEILRWAKSRYVVVV